MITLADDPMTAAVKLAKGNPGAATVLGRLLADDPVMGFIDLCHLDDMGISGSGIWIGYKDFAKQDLAVFQEAIRSRNETMRQMIALEE